ncbi:hypothetical protein OESDEN_08770 [Oesophagostomum dentatum]|uniref:Uncharacterized protein n=1 Tax=Oesophagostomum dentatum TaxID=61180 RepID=A0A0B1T6D4_OESDE|nr:hypothetical protein OESDEN_08770 [Oesophagostomum dentatum]
MLTYPKVPVVFPASPPQRPHLPEVQEQVP